MPCLEIAVILAAFQTSGNVEDKREALTIDVIKGSMIGRLSLSTRLGTLSIPGALILEGIALTINIIKCKLPTRRKSAFMKNEVVLFSQRFDFGISQFFKVNQQKILTQTPRSCHLCYTGNASQVSLQPDWQMDNGMFNNSVLACTQSLLHTVGEGGGAGAELGFCFRFSDALNPEFSSICGAARFIQFQ